MVSTRCRLVQGETWEKAEDGYIYLDASFWTAVVTHTGSAYRDWTAGTFRATRRRDMRSTGYQVSALGVEFASDQIEQLTGKSVTHAGLQSAPAEPESVRGKGGRHKGDGEIDDTAALDAMRRLIDARKKAGTKDPSRSAAARDVAIIMEVQGNALDSTVDRLRSKYSKLYGRDD
jgi:hypothetical protein